MPEARILHVTTSDQRRGAERVAFGLSGQLVKRGWHSDIVALAHRPPGGLDVQVLGRRDRSPATLLSLRRLARGYDVVVAHGSSTLDAAVVGLLGTTTPVVYVNIGDPTFWLTSGLKRRRVSWALRRCAGVIAIAQPAVAVLTGWLRVREDRVTVIRNSRDGDHFLPASPEQKVQARQALALPADRPVALVLGSLTPEKRVDVALEAVALTAEVHLLIVGDGPLRPSLQARAAKVLPGRATFLGSVADPREALAAADVLLLTSDTEGVPGVLVEGGLCGLPSVATDVGFVADVVIPGVTGVLVPPGSAVAAAAGLQDALGAADSLGASAREHCLRRHGDTAVLDAWELVLRTVTARQSS